VVLGLLVKGLKEDELRKKYSYGNYQYKNLSKNKEMNITQPTLGIEEYLKGLRKGVGL